MGEIACVNGVFGPIEQATISINDRGFQFADGVYEVVPAYGLVPFRLADHLERMAVSLRAIELDVDLDALEIEPLVHQGLRRCALDRAMVYIQITRGSAPRTHAMPSDLAPTLVMTFRSLPAVAPEQRRDGVGVITIPEFRLSRCCIKTTMLLPNILARRHARRCGEHDAVFVADDGEVREATSANVALVSGDTLVLPRRTERILHGVTLSVVEEWAAGAGLPVCERAVYRDEMLAADEIFLTNSSEEITPVTRIDGQSIGRGQPGPITARVTHAYTALARGLEPGTDVRARSA